MIKYPQLQNKEWLIEEIKKKSLRLIAKEIGSSYGALAYTVRKYNIEIPEDAIRQKRPTLNLSQKSKEGLAKKYPNGRFGELASRWKGGRKKNGAGYILVYKPEHPYASRGYIMEHRLIIEDKIGRMVKPSEYVHHINGIKDDNRIENLELCSSKKEHAKVHFDAVKENARLKKIIEELGGTY